MQFWMTGTPVNAFVTDPKVTWQDGRITGDLVALGDLQQAADDQDGLAVGPVGGPYTTRNHLADPLSAYILMLGLFHRSTVQVGGDVPQVPDLPEGAV